MKLNHMACALLLATPFTLANAGVTVTPLMLGYTFQDTQNNNGGDKGNLSDRAEIQDDLFVGAAIGVELTPWLGFEAEYNQVKGDINVEGNRLDGAQYKQQQINGNFYVTSDLITKNYDSKFKPYVLVGAGHYKYDFNDATAAELGRAGRGLKEEGTLGNAGVGAFYRINDALSLRTEARATYNADEEFWNYTALAGLNVVLGGHLKPAAPAVEIQPVAEPVPVPPPAPQPRVESETINLSADALFKFNGSSVSDLLPQGQDTLNRLVQSVTNSYVTINNIDIVGHTDRLGSEKYNYELGMKRAQTIQSYLASHGISTQMNVSSAGESQPVTTNCTGSKATAELKACLQPDRRVTLHITGVKKVVVQPQ
ncbi:OmpA family protein [Acinetobacter puyangensis]|uniref:OmpA-OmpF porin, OOP family n=1 Tax=Acinetobacter puyangensis TaxID=1096779 RepID=A0A240E988_9GAMM|nr:OmpA family protein [Acinetobacter puyangensis]SNX44803.1 OmpA-OmpF porin, OOP family [Acinetobacter puyangensis]